MPYKAPRICGCGRTIPYGAQCPCQLKRERERNARHEANRLSARARGYTSKWQRESKAFLALPENHACIRCGTPAMLVHHAIPHRGDPPLFWNRKNWRPACKRCHDGPLQSEEKRGL